MTVISYPHKLTIPLGAVFFARIRVAKQITREIELPRNQWTMINTYAFMYPFNHSHRSFGWSLSERRTFLPKETNCANETRRVISFFFFFFFFFFSSLRIQVSLNIAPRDAIRAAREISSSLRPRNEKLALAWDISSKCKLPTVKRTVGYESVSGARGREEKTWMWKKEGRSYRCSAPRNIRVGRCTRVFFLERRKNRAA